MFYAERVGILTFIEAQLPVITYLANLRNALYRVLTRKIQFNVDDRIVNPGSCNLYLRDILWVNIPCPFDAINIAVKYFARGNNGGRHVSGRNQCCSAVTYFTDPFKPGTFNFPVSAGEGELSRPTVSPQNVHPLNI